MEYKDSIKNISAALVKFQSEIKNPANTALNTFKNNRYAPLSDVLNTVRPVLAKYGLAVIQEAHSGGVGADANSVVMIKTILLHESGEYIEFGDLAMPAEKTAQAFGAAITYGRRYALAAILGISSEDDDDGNTANKPPVAVRQSMYSPTDKITENQRKRMFALAHGREEIVRTVLNKFNYQTSADVTKSNYNKICEEIEQAAKAEE